MIHIYLLSVADKCQGLPSLPNVKTTTIFPVIVGKEVEISCEEGRTLSGSNIITCVKDRQFQISNQPVCTKGNCNSSNCST